MAEEKIRWRAYLVTRKDDGRFTYLPAVQTRALVGVPRSAQLAEFGETEKYTWRRIQGGMTVLEIIEANDKR